METVKAQVRSMRMDDLEAVHQIDRLSFALPWPKDSFRYELLDNDRSWLWVVEVGQEIGPIQVVGVIVVWLILDEAHIATLAVHPEYRRHGFARKLLVTALQEAIGQGIRIATLEVRAGNEAARALYERFGFKIVGVRKSYYQDNQEDALIMTAGGLNFRYLEWLERRGWLKNEPPPLQ